jgi:hypothetical protein
MKNQSVNEDVMPGGSRGFATRLAGNRHEELKLRAGPADLAPFRSTRTEWSGRRLISTRSPSSSGT